MPRMRTDCRRGYVLPALVLAPVNGALSNSLPKRRVLIGSAAYCVAVAVGFALLNAFHPWPGWWLICLGFAAVGNAVYSPTRYGMPPAAAHDAHVPLTRVNGWIEMGSGCAIIAGVVVGGKLFEIPSPLGVAVPMIVVGMLLLYVAALVTAVPVGFPSDVYRPESPGRAIGGFFRDCKRILRKPEPRGYLLAVAALRGLVLASVGPIIAVYLEKASDPCRALDHVT